MNNDPYDPGCDEMRPDGIGASAIRPPGWAERNGGLIALLVLAAVVGAGLSGLLGGAKNEVVPSASAAARMFVHTPRLVRNGQIFETTITIEADAPIAKPVIGVSPSLWKDLTINSMTPAADKETYADGLFRFEFEPLQKGERLVLKIDAQVNPALFAGVAGSIVLLDGEAERTRIPLSIKVLP